MLNDAPVHVSIPVAEMARAIAFYRGKLGLAPSTDGVEGHFDCSAGTRIHLFPRPGANPQHTLAGFTVSNIEATVHALRANGVVFEEYDYPNLKTKAGIAETPGGRVAWFKDTEGNTLGIIQPPGM